MRETGIDWRAATRLPAAGLAAHLVIAALATRLPPLGDSLVFQHWANRLALGRSGPRWPTPPSTSQCSSPGAHGC